MKKLVSALLAAAMVTGLSAGTAFADDADKLLVYGIYKAGDQTWFIDEGEAAKNAVEALGGEFVYVDAKMNPEEYLKAIDNAVANQATGIVTCIPDQTLSQAAVDKCEEAGIPIFNVDTAVIEEDIETFVTQFVGTNAFMAGQLVGEQMVKDYPDGGDIAILDFPSNESCVDRVNGFLEGLGDSADKFNIVAQQDGAAALDASLPLAEDIITANENLIAFFCINDPSAQGAAAAVKAANKTGEIGVYSIDASPSGKQALLDGEFSAVAAQVPLQIAEYSFEQAVKYLDGETDLGDKKVYLDSHLVSVEEAEKTIDNWQ